MTQLRVRARAVDMLGRQQIAGIPTAIHELFKNAHDAYAERVEVDYFRRNRVLVIRDDGYGMTRDDVEKRWLTLGTESRVNANRSIQDDEWRGPKSLPRRSIMGEKGIGRLAIAVIAPVTILMSRAVRPDGLKSLVMAIVHWGLFEQPGLDISEIDIPISEFLDGALPTREDVGLLVDKILQNLISLKERVDPDAFGRLEGDLIFARSISPNIIDQTLNADVEDPLSLSGQGYGTHFIVLPVAPELDDDIDGGSDKSSSKLERSLLGFSNTMELDQLVIATEFRDHTVDGTLSRIGLSSFFDVDDFSRADQTFDGEFDEYGQFSGVVSIYGKPRKFVCNWIDGGGRKPRCGPFRFKYGYVQGRSSESRMPTEVWLQMNAKTERVGGLYIYRDGIRVLPYGNTDVDWLEIEKRRTLAAKDWFFSYRRGFGYVGITHDLNGSLTEKAGREGFRENLAYRDFRSILINFFKQLAYEFFRVSSPQGEDYNEGRAVLSAQAELLKKQQAKADFRRKKLDGDLEAFFSKYESGAFEAEAAAIREACGSSLERLNGSLDFGDFVERYAALELDVRRRLRKLDEDAQLSLPRGLALTKRIHKDWLAYEGISAQLRSSVLEPLRADIEQALANATKDRVDVWERRGIALQDVVREKEMVVKDLVLKRRDTVNALSDMQGSVHNVLREEFSLLREGVELLISDFSRQSADNPERLEELRYEAEKGLGSLHDRESGLLESLRRQMVELAEGVKDRETLDDRFAALEAKNQVLEEQIEFYSEFAQMGMSVGILQHEFERASRGIRAAMAEFKPWAEQNKPLDSIYKDLRVHIEHLDGYLKVLDPLGRRLHRSTVEISGDEIFNALRRVFDNQLADGKVQLTATRRFIEKRVKCKSSALLGAFINVVDNAIYWVTSRAEGTRIITLDADEFGFLVSNSGPGIEARFKDRIFDFGETSKPGGRGMGLAISRENLRREGFDIELLAVGGDVSPMFRILPKPEKEI